MVGDTNETEASNTLPSDDVARTSDQLSSSANGEADEASTAVTIDAAANRPGLVSMLGLSKKVHPITTTPTAAGQSQQEQ